MPDKIVDLRKLLAERFPHIPLSPIRRFPTRISFFDEAIGGGLPQGAITELVSPQTSGGTASLVSAFLRAAHRYCFFIGLIDGRDSFDPQPLGNACLRHLLWVRCQSAVETIKASDIMLRDSNFPLVIADLMLNRPDELRKIPATSWYRLQRLVEPTSTAFLVLSRQSMVSSAQLKLTLENRWTLPTFEQDNALSFLRLNVRRSHISQRLTKAS